MVNCLDKAISCAVRAERYDYMCVLKGSIGRKFERKKRKGVWKAIGMESIGTIGVGFIRACGSS